MTAAHEIDDKIAAVVHELNELGKDTRLSAAVRMGEIVVTALYGGELQAWEQHAHDDDAYRTLEAHPDLRIRPAQLRQSIRAFEVCRRHPWVLTSKHLTLSHIAETLALANGTQREVLQRTHDERWPVRKLRTAVRAATSAQTVTGRPRTPPALKTLMALLDHGEALQELDGILALEPTHAARLLQACPQLRADLERAEDLLRRVAAQLERPRAQVLIVDADRAFSERARAQLKRHRLAVRLAFTGRDALAVALTSSALRCAVIDVRLPDTTGADLAQRLHALRPELACVLTTATTANVEPMPSPGAQTAVPKSAGLVELKVAVAKAILGIP